MRGFFCFIFILFQVNSFSQAVPAFQDVLQEFPNIRDFTISIYGDEAYTSAQSPLGEISIIIQLNKKEGRWVKPTIASFSGKYHDLEPFMTQDGLRLYFASNRPLDSSSDEVKDYDIWYVERDTRSDVWSDPINVGEPINTSDNEYYPAIANNGNLYFTSVREGTKGLDDIFFAEYVEGEYLNPISLDSTINTEGYEFNSYISPDETLLLFSGYNRIDGQGGGDIYLSQKDEDGNWKEAVNLGDLVNSAQIDFCPFLDMQNNILYFTSRRSDIMPGEQEFKSIDEMKDVFNRYRNGQSRLYKVSIESILKK